MKVKLLFSWIYNALCLHFSCILVDFIFFNSQSNKVKNMWLKTDSWHCFMNVKKDTSSYTVLSCQLSNATFIYDFKDSSFNPMPFDHGI